MKRITAYLLALILCGAAFAGCEANRYVVVYHGSRDSDEEYENRQPAILTSAKEASDFYYENQSIFITGYDGRGGTHYNETLISEEYNDSFFESRNLLFIPTTVGTGSGKDSIQDIYLSDTALIVEILRVRPELGTDDMAYRYFIVSLDKALYSDTIGINITHRSKIF